MSKVLLEAGTTNDQPCNHYSILRTIELNFDLVPSTATTPPPPSRWIVR